MKKIKIPKRAIKDSIFSALVKRKKWLREVYISLYPNDKDIREEELEIVTLESIFVNGLYNDISFRVRDKLVVFIECQSTWSPNLPYRMEIQSRSLLMIGMTRNIRTEKIIYLTLISSVCIQGKEETFLIGYMVQAMKERREKNSVCR